MNGISKRQARAIASSRVSWYPMGRQWVLSCYSDSHGMMVDAPAMDWWSFRVARRNALTFEVAKAYGACVKCGKVWDDVADEYFHCGCMDG